MKLTCKSLPALLACWILCMTSGCAGMSGMTAQPDNHGGVVVYDTQGPMPRAVARVDAEGHRYVLEARSEIERGGGGTESLDESLDTTAASYSGPSDAEFWLIFTVVYLIILLIEVIIEAVD